MGISAQTYTTIGIGMIHIYLLNNTWLSIGIQAESCQDIERRLSLSSLLSILSARRPAWSPVFHAIFVLIYFLFLLFNYLVCISEIHIEITKSILYFQDTPSYTKILFCLFYDSFQKSLYLKYLRRWLVIVRIIWLM